eukprot:362057-Chlamydomonas_euryale.AAC.9
MPGMRRGRPSVPASDQSASLSTAAWSCAVACSSAASARLPRRTSDLFAQEDTSLAAAWTWSSPGARRRPHLPPAVAPQQQPRQCLHKPLRERCSRTHTRPTAPLRSCLMGQTPRSPEPQTSQTPAAIPSRSSMAHTTR